MRIPIHQRLFVGPGFDLRHPKILRPALANDAFEEWPFPFVVMDGLDDLFGHFGLGKESGAVGLVFEQIKERAGREKTVSDRDVEQNQTLRIVLLMLSGEALVSDVFGEHGEVIALVFLPENLLDWLADARQEQWHGVAELEIGMIETTSPGTELVPTLLLVPSPP